MTKFTESLNRFLINLLISIMISILSIDIHIPYRHILITVFIVLVVSELQLAVDHRIRLDVRYTGWVAIKIAFIIGIITIFVNGLLI
jgi:hypothetical protein